MKVLEDTPAVLSLGKLCDEHGYSHEWINCQKPHLIKNGTWIQRNTENFVPIVVLGLSTSSSSNLPSSTSTTPSRQEIDHPTSSLSSSTSPPVTSSTVSSESVARQEREDPCGIDSYPVTVSSKHVERQERRDPFCSEILEWLQEFRENLVDDRDPEHRDSHTSSSHEVSLEPTSKRSADLGKHSVYTHFPTDRYCEICQRTESTRAPCRRRIGAVLRAENFWWLDYSRSQSSQRRLWISKQSSICNRCAGHGHPMDPIISVQNKNFSGNPEKLAKVPGTREES